ncbi:hypothetical protein E3C22_18330 [Jiella endophytica]|uniref:SLATT domain-containing protein n=1 Tax=Jiella endophytica TaxID=2558362 RepID=A0A4Y8REW0_9HYPH|nr:hypothetical protein [Jiella endophytica]TFF20845.1 hypothetical protein E3C22_18330 [Jiella endophytica]
MENAPSLIELLKRNASGDLEALRRQFPEAAKLFSTERMLGPEDESAIPTAENVSGSGGIQPGRPTPFPNRAAVIALIETSLNTIIAEMDALTQTIRKTMKQVSRTRFAGAIVATIAGGLTSILALKFPNEVVQAVTAFVAMLGGITTVTADQFERAPSGVRIASAEEYAKLVEARSKVELIELKIARDNIIAISRRDLYAMLDELNDYALTVKRLQLA